MSCTTLRPHLCCKNAIQAVEFYKKAFGAVAPVVMMMPDGKLMHAGMEIDGAPFLLAEEFPDYGNLGPLALGGSPVTLHLQVADCDAVFAKAVAAGCTVSIPLADMFWGDRYGQVVDPFGHKWSIATTKKEVSPEEMQLATSQFNGDSPE